MPLWINEAYNHDDSKTGSLFCLPNCIPNKQMTPHCIQFLDQWLAWVFFNLAQVVWTENTPNPEHWVGAAALWTVAVSPLFYLLFSLPRLHTLGRMRRSGGQMMSQRPQVSSVVNIRTQSRLGKMQMRHKRNCCLLSSWHVPGGCLSCLYQ